MELNFSASEDEEIRNRGVNIIQHVQSSEAFDRYVEEQSGVRRPKKIRKYYVPKLNFDCKGYTNMIITKLEVNTDMIEASTFGVALAVVKFVNCKHDQCPDQNILIVYLTISELRNLTFDSKVAR